MGSRDEEREFSNYGRDRLIRLILGLRKERDAAYLQIDILKAVNESQHKRLDEMVEVIAQLRAADSKRLEEGLMLRGKSCSACGAFNSFEKERRAACRVCGLALR